jgi:hypothetical protein
MQRDVYSHILPKEVLAAEKPIQAETIWQKAEAEDDLPGDQGLRG